MWCSRASTSSARPVVFHRVLAHLQSRRGDAAGVDRLARPVGDLRRDEGVDRLGAAAPCSRPRHDLHSVGDQLLGILAVELVLRGARHGRCRPSAPTACAPRRRSSRRTCRHRGPPRRCSTRAVRACRRSSPCPVRPDRRCSRRGPEIVTTFAPSSVALVATPHATLPKPEMAITFPSISIPAVSSIWRRK